MKRAYCWKETHQEKKAHHIKSKRDFFGRVLHSPL